jgi:hypothetical protein
MVATAEKSERRRSRYAGRASIADIQNLPLGIDSRLIGGSARSAPLSPDLGAEGVPVIVHDLTEEGLSQHTHVMYLQQKCHLAQRISPRVIRSASPPMAWPRKALM